MFLLPKKYASISDVRAKDVIEAFPNAFNDTVNSYVLRFESILQVSSSKKLTVWVDVDPNLDVSVPNK